MTRIRSIAVIVGIGLVVALSACGNGPPEVGGVGGGSGAAKIGTAAPNGIGTPAKTVSATADLKFAPTSVTVKNGDVIQWNNTGSVPHNVTFDNYPDLTSQNLAQGDTWQVKITVAGTYAYHCTIHPGMDGQITVGG
jgi:plastocyanin